MKHKIFVGTVFLIATSLPSITTEAGIFGEGLGGAFRGAMLGSLIDGRDGAAAGAVIGGLIGAGEAASRNKKQKQREEAQQRQAQWAAQQQAEQQRIRERQVATAAPQQAANQTLVVETQKSLIRLGYDPGDIGTSGPALGGAITEYQESKGLLETGELSQALLTHMLRNGG